MNRADLTFKNGLVFTAGTLVEGGVAVTDGKISAIGATPFLPTGKVEIDLQGATLLPGGVDTHVHVRDPGGRERGTFETESLAAAAGGITTILEMPISSIPQYSVPILEERIRVAKGQSTVDFAFYGAAGNRPEHISDLAAAGAVAFKTYLFKPLAGREGEFDGACAEDDGNLLEIMEAVAKTGKILAVHAENDSIIQNLTKKLRKKGRRDFLAHGEARSPITEISAVKKIICYAEETGARVSICHVSTPEAMELIRKAKGRGMAVYAETCPQYLFCDEESATPLGPLAKFNPPIRARESVKRMWEFISDGTVDFIGSDHGPFLLSEKEPGFHDIFAAPSGSTGFEERLPLLMTAVKEKRLSLSRAVDLLSSNAAKIFDLHPAKGAIALGADGDLVAVNVDAPFRVDPSSMKTAGKSIARLYEGRELFGRVETTTVRGRVVYSRTGEAPPSPSWGECVPCFVGRV